MKPSDARSHNRGAWDQLAKNQNRLAKPAKEKDFVDPLSRLDGKGWLGEVSGRRILCLAAGGGRQGPLYASIGADVTVVDISPAMLELDRQVARDRGLKLRTVEASMDEMSALETSEFDIVIHPVSTCYVPDVRPVYLEVARVLRGGGIYVSQHKQPASLQTSIKPIAGHYQIESDCYSRHPLPKSEPSNLVREDGTLEFVHRWELLLGSMCRAGLVIEDISEPYHAKPGAPQGSFGHRSQYVPPYVRVKARRVKEDSSKLIH